jgi:hypothetical protein
MKPPNRNPVNNYLTASEGLARKTSKSVPMTQQSPEIDLAEFCGDQVPLEAVRIVWTATYEENLYSDPSDEIARVRDGDAIYSVSHHFLTDLRELVWFLSRLPLLMRPILLEKILSDLYDALQPQEDKDWQLAFQEALESLGTDSKPV